MRRDPIANLRKTLADVPRGTRSVSLTRAGKREEFGRLVAALAGDVVAACAASIPPDDDREARRIVADLHAGSACLPPQTVVRIEADDLYTVLDHLPPPPPPVVEAELQPATE